MKVVIIDYGAGNVKSIANILNYLGVDFEISADKTTILSADKIIFPGQGHFKQAIEHLTKKDLISVIKEAVQRKIPFLGICLGLQILFEKSEEAPNIAGLCLIKGEVKKFTKGKIPQIGWNKIKTTKNNSFLQDGYFYFVNSYYVVPEEKDIISSICDYNGEFCASIQKDNITAVQFHPEKSSSLGLEFFKKWINPKFDF